MKLHLQKVTIEEKLFINLRSLSIYGASQIKGFHLSTGSAIFLTVVLIDTFFN